MTNNPQIEPQKTENGEAQPDIEYNHPPQQPIITDIPPSKCNKDQSMQDKCSMKKLKFHVEVATLCVLACYTLITGYQGWKMREATEAAKVSADAAKLAATVSEKTFNENNIFANNTLIEMKRQSTAMQESSNYTRENIRQNRTALDTTIQQFKLEQRAWLSPKISEVSVYNENDKTIFIKEGQPFKVTTSIVNTGKTFAKKIKVYVATAYIGPNEPPDCTESFFYDNFIHSSVVIYPNQPIHIPEQRPAASKEVVDALIGGQKMLYVRGLITYEDIFSQAHFSKFCVYLTRNLQGFAPCNTCNDAN